MYKQEYLYIVRFYNIVYRRYFQGKMERYVEDWGMERWPRWNINDSHSFPLHSVLTDLERKPLPY